MVLNMLEVYLTVVVAFLLAFWLGNLFCLITDKERVAAIKEYRKLKAEVDGFAAKIEELQKKKEALRGEVEGLSSTRNVVYQRVEELRNELQKLEDIKRRAYIEGYEYGYSKVIQELRSLRAQKSAVIELFTRRCPELNAKLKECTGREIVKYLKQAKEEKLREEMERLLKEFEDFENADK